MNDHTGIEWTDATWNPVTGCAKVSQGCKNCYAEREWGRLVHLPNYAGRAFTDVQCHPDRLLQPYHWARPRRIFVNSMSDLFHPAVPFEFIASVFWVMSVTTRHTYQVLTKRPERMLEFFEWVEDGAGCFGDERIDDNIPEVKWKPRHNSKRGGYDTCGPVWPYENVWLGVSVEDQETADKRIPILLKVPAAVRWISAEPILGPIDLWKPNYKNRDGGLTSAVTSWEKCGVDWVVAGGESGPGARPMHPDWVRLLRDQCAGADVPFLFKQWGEWVDGNNVPKEAENAIWHAKKRSVFDMRELDLLREFKPAMPEGRPYFGCNYNIRVGKKSAGRLLDGVLHDEYPGRAE